MAYNVLELAMVSAYNVDALNRTAHCDEDIENGSVFVLNSRSTEAGERYVWMATAPAAATDTGLWMAASPEVVITPAGEGDGYRGLTPDPRAFINKAGRNIDAIKLMPGDIIRMTAEGIADADTNDYLVPSASSFKLVSAAAAGDGFALKKIGTTHLRIGQPGIVKTAIPMYEYEVVKN